MAAYSALDFVTRALRLLGVCDPTETPQPEDAETGFQVLNDMVDAWATKRQTIHTIARTQFALSASTPSYTLGDGGDWDIVRPVWIEGVSVIPNTSDPIEVPIGRPLDIKQYQLIPQKDATSSMPTAVYWDRSWTAGLSRVYVFPIPDNDDCAIVLYTPAALTEFADQSTQYTFPPGYAKALRYNLALELAPEYGLEPPKAVARQAMLSLADIQRANFAPVEAGFDPALVGRRRYNIYTDQ